MGSGWATLKEWINPSWGRHRTVPPMEAGLRPNDLLERAEVRFAGRDDVVPDDIVALDGRIFFSSAAEIRELGDAGSGLIARFDGTVTALAVGQGGLVAAVEGRGLMQVAPDGGVRELSAEEATRSCVTDISVRDDGTVLLSIGSTTRGPGDWSSCLLLGESDGALVLVRDGRADTVASGLPWPSGVEWDGENVVVSLSLAHRIERRPIAEIGAPGAPLASNMAIYPGRISAASAGWWVAGPYVRNRFTELLLDEPGACRDMMETIDRDQWFVPRLGLGNPWTDPLQIGQIRVLGVVKPWAPARSYGLVFHLGANGRVTRSYQSRVDGTRHGVTGVVPDGDGLLAAARGAAEIYRIPQEG